MRASFDEWCDTQKCSECKFKSSSSRRECEELYDEDLPASTVDLRRIEKKIDAIIKHFNVTIEK